MHILITNDDGVHAKGLQVLIKQMSKLGRVTVVAPDSARSGQSSAISIEHPIRVKQLLAEDNLNIYSCNGTPADCAKIAVEVLLENDRPDLLVAGVNHGSNSAINVIYSGTMGAIFVGAENMIPSIGFSLNDHLADADFSSFEPYILPLTKKILQLPVRYGLCYNINVSPGEVKGVRVTRQCKGYWHREYEEYTDPHGEKFYLLSGEFCNTEPEAEDTDEWALKNGYIAITPTTIDMTDYTDNNLKSVEWSDLTNIL